MSFLPDRQSKPLLKVLHRTLQHFLRQSCDFLTNGKFQLFDRTWSVRIHSRLEVSPPPKKRRSQIDRYRRNGISHVGGTCVEQLPAILSPCELWHRPVGTTFLSCLPHTFGVLDAGSCLTCRRSASKSLKMQSPPFQKSKDQRSLPSKHRTTRLLLSCGEVFGVVLVGSPPPRTGSSVCSQIHSDRNELRHSSLPRR